jgi:hypothetical protein
MTFHVSAQKPPSLAGTAAGAADNGYEVASFTDEDTYDFQSNGNLVITVAGTNGGTAYLRAWAGLAASSNHKPGKKAE